MFFCVISFVAESALPRLDKAASSAKVTSAETESSSSTVVESDSSANSNSPTTSSHYLFHFLFHTNRLCD